MSDQSDGNELRIAMQAEKEIRRINDEWVDALIRGDITALLSTMDENCIFTYALEGEDRTQFLAEIQAGDLQVDSLKRENVEVRIYGATGVLTAFDVADWLYKGRRIRGHYRTMHVYAERDNQWEIVAIQASPISSK